MFSAHSPIVSNVWNYAHALKNASVGYPKTNLSFFHRPTTRKKKETWEERCSLVLNIHYGRICARPKVRPIRP